MVLTFTFKDNQGREVSNLSVPLPDCLCATMPVQQIADRFVTPYLDSLFADGLVGIGCATIKSGRLPA